MNSLKQFFGALFAVFSACFVHTAKQIVFIFVPELNKTISMSIISVPMKQSKERISIG